MKKFYLNILLKILGVSAASGLTYSDEIIHLVSDNSNYLYNYNIKEKTLSKDLLVADFPFKNVAKKDKADFESMLEGSDAVYVFGSGSEPNREKGYHFNKIDKKVMVLDLGTLYMSMRDFAEIKPQDFNIEGVAYNGTDWFFLNRGNGPNNKNVVITVQGANLTDDFNLFYNDFELPKINGIQTGFSDAVLIKNKLFFIATAENNKSTYHDGAIGGSLFGCIDLKKMKIEFTEVISTEHKFEGLTVYKRNGKKVSFLLCEDTDTDTQESIIYQLDVELKKRIK